MLLAGRDCLPACLPDAVTTKATHIICYRMRELFSLAPSCVCAWGWRVLLRRVDWWLAVFLHRLRERLKRVASKQLKYIKINKIFCLASFGIQFVDATGLPAGGACGWD